jgi:hypothetical protein
MDACWIGIWNFISPTSVRFQTQIHWKHNVRETKEATPVRYKRWNQNIVDYDLIVCLVYFAS